nr:MAG TPA: hypothetical protein [Caudoviricetes sp.]
MLLTLTRSVVMDSHVMDYAEMAMGSSSWSLIYPNTTPF